MIRQQYSVLKIDDDDWMVIVQDVYGNGEAEPYYEYCRTTSYEKADEIAGCMNNAQPEAEP